MRLTETATTPDAVARLLARQGLAPRPAYILLRRRCSHARSVYRAVGAIASELAVAATTNC